MAILSCHVSIKLPPKISDGQPCFTRMAGMASCKLMVRKQLGLRKTQKSQPQMALETRAKGSMSG